VANSPGDSSAAAAVGPILGGLVERAVRPNDLWQFPCLRDAERVSSEHIFSSTAPDPLPGY